MTCHTLFQELTYTCFVEDMNRFESPSLHILKIMVLYDMGIECQKNNDLQTAVEFLVPFTNILVNLLSEKNITTWDFKKKLNNIKITNLSDKDGQVESSSIVNNYRVYLLYGGTRNFLLKIEGLSVYMGFCILVTNKGMLVNSEAAENPLPSASDLKDLFLDTYKSPYLLTNTFLKFIEDN